MTFYPADHSVACQAGALQCALENLRDEEGTTKHSFRIQLQDNALLRMADEYLDETGGFMPDVCKCHVKHMVHIQTVYTHEGVSAAQVLARKYLDDREISPENYVMIVKWTEGR